MPPSYVMHQEHDVELLKLVYNGKELAKVTNTIRMHTIDVFLMWYSLHHSGWPFQKFNKNRLLLIILKRRTVIWKLLLSRNKSAKKTKTTMLRLIYSFPTLYYLHQSDKQFENGDQKIVQR
jgi:hypothetical protein